MGLLPEQNSLIPATSNRNMLAQALKARQTTPRNQLTGQGLLDVAASGLGPIPIVGDAMGLAADASRFYNEPESRTPLNFGLAALGAIPFLPPLVSMGLGKLAQSQGKTLGQLPAGPRKNQAGAIVWHGSPHLFPPTPNNPLGEFNFSKIGTGEGKQQQGFGGYLADSQSVGQKYADKEAFKRGMDSGYLYKVDIPDEIISKMAAHDLPFSRQPDSVKGAVNKIFGADELSALKAYHGWDSLDDAPFSAVMDSIEIAKGNNRAAAANALRQQGIPGIKYLDGGSRGAGQGTYNYVVFPGNESLLKILSRE